MDLYKNFAVGGLFQAGKRMAPPWGAFRRFTNCYKDPARVIQPYGRGIPTSNDPVIPAGNGAGGFTNAGPVCSQYFKRAILQLHAMESFGAFRGIFSYKDAAGNNLPIMQPYRSGIPVLNTVTMTKHMTYKPSGNFSTCTVARKAYINSYVNESEFDSTLSYNSTSPVETYLMSFDGVRPRGAGLPTPWTAVDSSGTLGNFYTRTVYATIGIDGELILSPYLQQQLSSATRDVYLGGYTTFPTVRTPDVVGQFGAANFPKYRRPEDHLFEEIKTSNGFGAAYSNLRYFDKRFIQSNGVASITNGELKIVRGEYSPCVAVGDWVMVDIGTPLGTLPATLFMFKVKTLAANTVFETNIKYLDQNSVTWIDADLNDVYTEWNNISVDIGFQFLGTMSGITFSNIFMIISYSTTAASGYVVHDIIPVSWDSAQKSTRVLSSGKNFPVPWAGIISSQFADWYDITAVKTTFPPVKGVTNYKDLLVGFDANAIYYNDISLGGSTEMVSGLSNLVPNGSEYGDIVAICGSEDFLFVSRERKNYVITGDIAGSSFNITECDSPVPGAHNARAVTNAWAGQVIFMNSTGVFAVSSSGTIKELSEEISGLFFGINRDQNLFQKSVFRTLNQTRSSAYDGGIFKFFLEGSRRFVILLTASSGNGAFNVQDSNMLVLDTRDGKWYEFEGVGASSAEAIDGKIVTLGVQKAIEIGHMYDRKQLLVTQWLTIDAPSLEKQACQVKLYGDIEADDDGDSRLTIGQQNEWAPYDDLDRTDWNTNTEYFMEQGSNPYYHKKRLNSSKATSTSIIIESSDKYGTFSLEGMEIEGIVVQQGMKK